MRLTKYYIALILFSIFLISCNKLESISQEKPVNLQLLEIKNVYDQNRSKGDKQSLYIYGLIILEKENNKVHYIVESKEFEKVQTFSIQFVEDFEPETHNLTKFEGEILSIENALLVHLNKTSQTYIYTSKNKQLPQYISSLKNTNIQTGAFGYLYHSNTK